MKVLIDHHSPFLLAHGGVQVQIEETLRALQEIGVAAEYVRWWDVTQTGDILHVFGAVSSGYLNLARQKGLPVVLTSFFSATCNRPDSRLALQGLLVRTLLAIPGWETVKMQLNWRAVSSAPYHVVGLNAEAKVLSQVYDVPSSRISVIPLGTRIPVNQGSSNEKQPYLICVGTIYAVKRSLELAELARQTGVPVLFVGKPYSYDSPYWKEFQKHIDQSVVRYHAHVQPAELDALLYGARGFVLLSDFENWSLAAHEAAAAGVPILVPDMKWSRECFGNAASYFPSDPAQRAAALKRFYEESAQATREPMEFPSWKDVAERLSQLYRKVLLDNSQNERNPAGKTD